jgi:hypothetical protein
MVGMIGLSGLESNIQWISWILTEYSLGVLSDWPCLDRFAQVILNLVREILHCACGTYYNQNCNCGTGSRSGDLHQFGWFNLCLDRFSQGILNLVTEFSYLVCNTQYWCFCVKNVFAEM